MKGLQDKQRGATMVEYVLIIALVAVVAAAAFKTFEGKITTALATVSFAP